LHAKHSDVPHAESMLIFDKRRLYRGVSVALAFRAPVSAALRSTVNNI
jgi:hypothetical protein